MSSTLQNVYYERKVGTARACYVCNRPTQTVLATIKAEDFIYTCDSHLSDPGFVTPIASSGPSADDIRKVIAEYNSREARRTERKAELEKEKESEKDKEKDKDDKKEDKSMLSSLASAAASAASSAASAAVSSLSPKPMTPTTPTGSGSSPPSPPMTGVPSVPAQTHKKYALHRTFFENRKSLLRSRENTAKAKEVSKGLPQVPRGF